MRLAANFLAVATLLLASDVAFAFNEEAIFAPTAWGGLAIGLVAGAWTGYKGSHPGEGLAWGIGLLFLALFTWVALEGELFWGLFFLLLVPFLGAIPLAIGYLLTYTLGAMLKDFIEKKTRA